MITSRCELCGTAVHRLGYKAGRFCSVKCKYDYQRSHKPIEKERLYDLYVTQGKSTYEIAKIVDRNAKTVFSWLRGYGIPTRRRVWDTTPNGQLHQNAEWLRHQYADLNQSTAEIAAKIGRTDVNVGFFLRRFGIARRSVSESRRVKHWGPDPETNPFNRRGPSHWNWKGGLTPERQVFYGSSEWTEALKVVYGRGRLCERCKRTSKARKFFHVHHIVSFAVRELRADPSNLVLLCSRCHRWVHGKKNFKGLFLAPLFAADLRVKEVAK